MSAYEGGGEGTKHRRLGFNGNEIPRSVHADDSTIAPRDIANDDREDDSLAGGVGKDGVYAPLTAKQREERKKVKRAAKEAKKVQR